MTCLLFARCRSFVFVARRRSILIAGVRYCSCMVVAVSGLWLLCVDVRCWLLYAVVVDCCLLLNVNVCCLLLFDACCRLWLCVVVFGCLVFV